MDQSKMTTVNDLYALRAGLSIISQESDDIRQYYKELNEEYEQTMSAEYNRYVSDFVSAHNISKSNELNDHLATAKLWRRNTYDDYGRNTANYCDELYEREYQLQSLTEKCEKTKSEIKSNRNYAISRGFLCALFAIGAIVKISLGIVLSILPMAIIGGLGCSIISIIFLVCANAERNGVKSDKEMLIYYKEVVALYPEWKQNLVPIVSKIDAQMNAKLQAKIKPIVKKGNFLYIALQEEFGHMIDMRDWKHLDLIIYYLETGRADTIKEALQLVEREMQTERIVDAIERVSKQICMAINMAARRISSRLDTLSAQLTDIAVQQHMHLESNKRLIEAAEMQNALLAKANMNSEALIQEAEYIIKVCDK